MIVVVRVRVGAGVGMVVGESDEGDDRVGDEVLSEESGSSGCR